MSSDGEWTPEAVAEEEERRAVVESRGVCPDAGLTIAQCWRVGLCDCAWLAPTTCPGCGVVVWNLPDHERREHPV
jgi:hypothetical protein